MFTWTNGGTPDLAQLGAHDLVANANFVDPTRNLATFDTAYLGNTATAWSSGRGVRRRRHRRHGVKRLYGNARVNFRCIAAHTSASGNATNGQPGATGTTSWRSRWGAGLGLPDPHVVGRLLGGHKAGYAERPWTWVRAGFAPTNTALRGPLTTGRTSGRLRGPPPAPTALLNFICEG